MTAFYKVNLGRVSLREHRRICKSTLGFVIHAFIRLLRLPVTQLVGLVRPQPIGQTKEEFAALPAASVARLRVPVEQCIALGFGAPLFQTKREDLNYGESSVAYLLHDSGDAIAKLTYWTIGAEVLTVSFITRLADSWLWTTNQPYQLDSAPCVLPQVSAGAAPAELWKTHRQRIANAPQTSSVRKIPNPDEFEKQCDEFTIGNFDYLVARGVYEEIGEREIVHAQRVKEIARANGGAVESEHAPVFAELVKLQNAAPKSWMRKITVFAVSLVAFASAGAMRHRVWGIVALVFVLFVHELGHFVAMRLFRYRNVQMFFIPFFGAAVSGHHFCVPGYKRAIVALMGPLPGIVIGAALGIAGAITGHDSFVRLALLFLVLNLSNLLPLLPLDGGWFFQIVLFSRNPWIETLFRIFAALGLLGVAAALHAHVFMILGIVMAMAIPRIHRAATIAQKLRRRGQLVTAETTDIDPQAATVIMREIKDSMPSLKLPKDIASVAMSIYERIFSRAPSLPASLGLTGAYAGAVVLGLGFTVFLSIQQHPDAFRRGFAEAERRHAAKVHVAGRATTVLDDEEFLRRAAHPKLVCLREDEQTPDSPAEQR